MNRYKRIYTYIMVTSTSYNTYRTSGTERRPSNGSSRLRIYKHTYLIYKHTNISIYTNIRISFTKYPNISIYTNIRISFTKYPNISIYTHISISFTSIQICPFIQTIHKHTYLIYKHTNVSIYKYTNTSSNGSSYLQMYKLYLSIRVYGYIYIV